MALPPFVSVLTIYTLCARPPLLRIGHSIRRQAAKRCQYRERSTGLMAQIILLQVLFVIRQLLLGAQFRRWSLLAGRSGIVVDRFGASSACLQRDMCEQFTPEFVACVAEAGELISGHKHDFSH